MMELSVRFRRGEGDEATRLLRHLERGHGREPGVADAIQQMLVDFGVLRPDGTPAYVARRPPEGPTAPASQPVASARGRQTLAPREPTSNRRKATDLDAGDGLGTCGQTTVAIPRWECFARRIAVPGRATDTRYAFQDRAGH